MNSTLRKVIFIFSVVIFTVSSGLLVKLLWIDPSKNNNTISTIQDAYHATENLDPLDKIKNLAEINPDIKGWITVPNTEIDYPVLFPSADEPSEYYLYKDYNREYTKYGSIFIDKKCAEDVQSKNILIHGHNMIDGSMFHDITKFTKLDFYKTTPVITFNTVDESNQWKVIAVFRTNTLPEHGEIFDYLQYKFASDTDFMNFVREELTRSLICTTVDVNKDDVLLTLSTCSYEYKNFRTVVVTRKVRPGEDTEVDVENAIVNPSPLLPECYR